MQDHAFIGRQPILNAKQHIIGYELLFRHSAEAESAVIEDDLKACVRVLVNTLNEMGARWLLGDKLAFINVNEGMLHSEYLELLPPERTVLEILKTVVPDDAVVERCKELCEQGFRIALDNYELAESSPALLACASYLKIDTLAVGLQRAGEIFRQYSSPSLKLIAEKVETRTQQEVLQQIGFQFFQGFYFARPETLTAKIINPSYTAVFNLLNLVSRDANNSEIEKGFKLDTALSFKLLRYINSTGFGLSCEIQSINHALSILGRKQLYRWLTLLLVTAGKNAATSALMKTSITRGRFTELLGESYFDKHDRDNLFIVGIFSLLDAILEMPMELVLDKIQLPETVSEALLNRGGVYGPFLQLAEACEDADVKRVKALAESLQFDPDKVNDCHIAALAWVETLGI
jgi:EAL and modified HD-GYP domain-containing signal transduction protein